MKPLTEYVMRAPRVKVRREAGYLLAPGTIERSWNSGRVFPMVEGSLRVERQLPAEEAADIVERILARKRDES